MKPISYKQETGDTERICMGWRWRGYPQGPALFHHEDTKTRAFSLFEENKDK